MEGREREREKHIQGRELGVQRDSVGLDPGLGAVWEEGGESRGRRGRESPPLESLLGSHTHLLRFIASLGFSFCRTFR